MADVIGHDSTVPCTNFLDFFHFHITLFTLVGVKAHFCGMSVLARARPGPTASLYI